MSNVDTLSQEEMDALLNGETGGYPRKEGMSDDIKRILGEPIKNVLSENDRTNIQVAKELVGIFTGGNREKNNILRFIIIVIIAFVVGGFVSAAICFSKNTAGGGRIAEYKAREREYIERIAEYQQREEARIRAEKDRIRAENERITREGERIARTEEKIGALWGFDRRSDDLLELITKEANILQDYFYLSKREYFNALDSGSGKISP